MCRFIDKSARKSLLHKKKFPICLLTGVGCCSKVGKRVEKWVNGERDG